MNALDRLGILLLVLLLAYAAYVLNDSLDRIEDLENGLEKASRKISELCETAPELCG